MVIEVCNCLCLKGSFQIMIHYYYYYLFIFCLFVCLFVCFICVLHCLCFHLKNGMYNLIRDKGWEFKTCVIGCFFVDMCVCVCVCALYIYIFIIIIIIIINFSYSSNITHVCLTFYEYCIRWWSRFWLPWLMVLWFSSVFTFKCWNCPFKVTQLLLSGLFVIVFSFHMVPPNSFI